MLDINKNKLVFDCLDDTGDQFIFLVLILIIYALLFVFLDTLFQHLLGNIDGSSADLIKIDFLFDDVTDLGFRIDLKRIGKQDIKCLIKSISLIINDHQLMVDMHLVFLN